MKTKTFLHPGLCVVGCDERAATTLVAGLIARSLRQDGVRAGVFRAFAAGCEKRREGYVSPEVELLAHWSDTEQALEAICPVNLPETWPSCAEVLARDELLAESTTAAFHSLLADFDTVVVDGTDWAYPLGKNYWAASLLAPLACPLVLAVTANPKALEACGLAILLAEKLGMRILGTVLTGYWADQTAAGIETIPRLLEAASGLPVLAILSASRSQSPLDPAVLSELLDPFSQCDWRRLFDHKS